MAYNAVMAYNVSRAAAVLAGGKLGKARTATIGTRLINIPARPAFSAGTYNLHLPVTPKNRHTMRTRTLTRPEGLPYRRSGSA